MAVKKARAKTKVKPEESSEEKPKGKNAISITAVIALVGVLFTYLNYNHTLEKDKQAAVKDSIAAANEAHKLTAEYEKQTSTFNDVNEDLYKNGTSARKLKFATNSEKKIPLAISYASLNYKWACMGYLMLNRANPFIFHKTNNSYIYIYLDPTSPDLQNKLIAINAVELSQLESESRTVRADNNPFTILNDFEPPYKTKRKNFYKVKIPDNDSISIRVIDIHPIR